MLTKEQLQQVREKIILARHPECKTIEEAMEKEFTVGSFVLCHQEMLRDVGPAQDYVATVCEIEKQDIDEKTYEPLYEEVKITSEFNAYQVDSIVREKYRQSHDTAYIKEVLGLPLDLASVLNAMGAVGDYGYCRHYIIHLYDGFDSDSMDIERVEEICPWQLLKDGKPCTFDDQTEQTKEAIAKVLGII